MIVIDGSYLEGGGQILRNALSFSCVLGRPIRICKIRANRSNPGLSHQHLHVVKLLQQITGADVTGDHLKSTEITFKPGNIKAGNYNINTKTAASISLILQAALPVLAFANGDSQVEVIGGTNVSNAPQIEYLTEVMKPLQEICGFTYDFDLLHRGYYPRGGGVCKIHTRGINHLLPIKLTNLAKIDVIDGWCFVAGRLPLKLAEDMHKIADTELGKLGIRTNIFSYKEDSDIARENGSGIILRAASSSGCILGSSSLGEKHVNAEKMGKEAAHELIEYINAGVCIDKYAQDQLIIYMALAADESCIKTCKLTNHTLTAISVAEQMCEIKFKTTTNNLNEVIISCQGLAHKIKTN